MAQRGKKAERMSLWVPQLDGGDKPPEDPSRLDPWHCSRARQRGELGSRDWKAVWGSGLTQGQMWAGSQAGLSDRRLTGKEE